MKLAEVAYVTNTRLETGLTISGGYHVSLHGLEIVDNGTLKGAVGFGDTEMAARLELAKALAWTTVTNGGTTRPRSEYPLPEVEL